MTAGDPEIEHVIEGLRASGCSKVQSIEALVKGHGLQLADAKVLVHFSPTWLDRQAADDDLHDQLSDLVAGMSKADGAEIK